MSDLSVDVALRICEVLENISTGDLDTAETLLESSKFTFGPDQACEKLAGNFMTLINQLREGGKFANALSGGDLKYEAPRNFYLFSEYKQLQANLRHLTWQTQQIAKGDYSQSVNFMGEFSEAFNQMIEGLRAADKTQQERLAGFQNLDIVFDGNGQRHSGIFYTKRGSTSKGEREDVLATPRGSLVQIGLQYYGGGDGVVFLLEAVLLLAGLAHVLARRDCAETLVHHLQRNGEDAGKTVREGLHLLRLHACLAGQGEWQANDKPASFVLVHKVDDILDVRSLVQPFDNSQRTGQHLQGIG